MLRLLPPHSNFAGLSGADLSAARSKILSALETGLIEGPLGINIPTAIKTLQANLAAAKAERDAADRDVQIATDALATAAGLTGALQAVRNLLTELFAGEDGTPPFPFDAGDAAVLATARTAAQTLRDTALAISNATNVAATDALRLAANQLDNFLDDPARANATWTLNEIDGIRDRASAVEAAFSAVATVIADGSITVGPVPAIDTAKANLIAESAALSTEK